MLSSNIFIGTVMSPLNTSSLGWIFIYSLIQKWFCTEPLSLPYDDLLKIYRWFKLIKNEHESILKINSIEQCAWHVFVKCLYDILKTYFKSQTHFYKIHLFVHSVYVSEAYRRVSNGPLRILKFKEST